MLKIKDNVDLKELEKFGFEKFDNRYFFITKDDEIEYDIFEDRYIKVSTLYDGVIYSLDNTIYDLIKANLVEKVEDKGE